MEELVGAQYAVQIALQTLKERCRTLQQRVTNLEEENVNLRINCSKSEQDNTSLSEVDKLKGQIAELTEHKEQLQNKVKMVTSENQELWTKLSKLTHVNQNLGTQLSKINDSLIEYTSKSKETHSPLIRSKTFTQDEPHTKVLQRNLEENGRICSELEEISLKIINSFAQGKIELDSLYSEIAELQYGHEIISDSCGFYYDDYDDNIMEKFHSIVEELKATREIAHNQKTALQLALNKINSLQEIKKNTTCDNKTVSKETSDKSTSTEDEIVQPSDKSAFQGDLPESNSQASPEEITVICPICSMSFNNTDLQVLQEHVEQHFTEETFEVL